MRPEAKYEPTVPRVLYNHGIHASDIAEAPKEIVQKLKSAGFEAYLVGGCIRDLLLGLKPKDFDVVTDANPEEVHQIFPRSRVIGHRFRIVHVYDRRGHHVTEVSTFRGRLDADQLTDQRVLADNGVLIRDNEYGTLEEDPHRRDFTVNSLYFDIDRNAILDFCGGLEDVEAKVLRSIGSAHDKFIEDPARMLRAVRFIATRGLKPDTEIVEAIQTLKHRLKDVRPSRMNDEFHKLFLTGSAQTTYSSMREFDLMNELLVQSDASVTLTEQAMANTDQRFRDDRPVIAAFLFAVMLWHDYQREAKRSSVKNGNNETRFLAASKIIGRLHQRVSIPRRTAEFVRDTFELQFPLESRKPQQIKSLLEKHRFRAAYDLLQLRAQVGEAATPTVEWWEKVQTLEPDALNQAIRDLSPRKKRRRRRRRKPRHSFKGKASTMSAHQSQ